MEKSIKICYDECVELTLDQRSAIDKITREDKRGMHMQSYSPKRWTVTFIGLRDKDRNDFVGYPTDANISAYLGVPIDRVVYNTKAIKAVDCKAVGYRGWAILVRTSVVGVTHSTAAYIFGTEAEALAELAKAKTKAEAKGVHRIVNFTNRKVLPFQGVVTIEALSKHLRMKVHSLGMQDDLGLECQAIVHTFNGFTGVEISS